MNIITREFTKEQLIGRALENIHSLEHLSSPEVLQMDLMLIKIALASLTAEPVSISDDMAYAFHHAQSDSSLGDDEVEEIKTGLRAAFANISAIALRSRYCWDMR